MTARKLDDIYVLNKDIDELKVSLKNLTIDLQGLAETRSESAAQKAGAKLGEIREDVAGAAHKIADQGRQSAEAVADAVKERPLQSLIVAFGVGLLLSRLLDRR